MLRMVWDKEDRREEALTAKMEEPTLEYRLRTRLGLSGSLKGKRGLELQNSCIGSIAEPKREPEVNFDGFETANRWASMCNLVARNIYIHV
jgi:hypothetical protein